MKEKDFSNLLELCREQGEKSPKLWIEALSLLSEQGQLDTEDQALLSEILAAVESKNLLSPLKVVQILSRNTYVTVGMVKDFLIRRVQIEKSIMEEASRSF